MKKNLSLILMTALVFLGTAQLSFAQFSAGVGYLNSQPSGLMDTYIQKAAHGAYIEGLFTLPNTRLSIGLNLSFSGYGFEKRNDRYLFDNGYEGEVDVEISNNFGHSNLFLQYDLAPEGFAQPYVLLGVGLSKFWTDLEILDPREEFTSDCPKPVESAVLLKDRTTHFMLGAGLRFDLSRPIKSLSKDYLLFDIRVSYLGGGDVSYMNVDEPQLSGPSTVNIKGENVVVDFVSEAQPDIIHEYHAGKSYGSPMQLVSIQAGFTVKFSNR